MSEQHREKADKVAQEIRFKQPLPTDLFDTVAQKAAKCIHSKDKNKSTQIRHFYDELLSWSDKIFSHTTQESQEERFHKELPFIKMMKAKVAYAEGRELLTSDFVTIFNRIVDEINDPQSLKYGKLFFEAVLGFRRAEELHNRSQHHKKPNGRHASSKHRDNKYRQQKY